MRAINCFLLALVACGGCISPRGRTGDYDKPAYSELAIRTKCWNLEGHRTIQFLDWQSIHHELRGAQEELVIAKYGDKSTGNVTCLEFFRPLRKLIPGGQDTFVLLDHDSRFDVVTSLNPVLHKGSVDIEITRETPAGLSLPRRRSFYVLSYTKDYTIQPSLSELTFFLK